MRNKPIMLEGPRNHNLLDKNLLVRGTTKDPTYYGL